MSSAAVAALIQRSLTSYLFDAWPFALLYCIVVLHLVRLIIRALRQTSELDQWNPGVAIEAGPPAILASFVRDSESFWQRGLIVPITDYSSRLDSAVSNLAKDVSKRLSQLLLVGVVGTLFGVLELSWSVLVGKDNRLSDTGALLAECLAKALPVGLAGLILVLFFELSLTVSLARLREAADGAILRALDHRGRMRQASVEAIDHSLDLLQQSASDPGDGNPKPSTPVVKELDRYPEHDGAAEQPISAARDHSSAVEPATHSLSRLEETLSELPTALAEHVAAAISPAFELVAVESSKTWHNLLRVVTVDIQRDYAEFIASSREELKHSNLEMRALSESMRRFAETAQASMTEPLHTAIETARREVLAALAGVGEFVRESYPALRDDMKGFRDAMGDIVKTLTLLNKRISKNVPASPPVGDERDEMLRVLRSIKGELRVRNVAPFVDERTWSERLMQFLGLR